MKTSILLVGLLVTTIAVAQVRTAPPAALAVPNHEKKVSPLAGVGDATAIDPQFELLRKQISLLKQQQLQQHEQIVRLQACVRELARADRSDRGPRQAGASLDSSPGILVGTSSLGPPINGSPGQQKSIGAGKSVDDKHELNDHVGKLAPGPARINLSSCD